MEDMRTHSCGKGIAMAANEVEVSPDECSVIRVACADELKTCVYICCVGASFPVMGKGADPDGFVLVR